MIEKNKSPQQMIIDQINKKFELNLDIKEYENQIDILKALFLEDNVELAEKYLDNAKICNLLGLYHQNATHDNEQMFKNTISRAWN